MADPRSRRRALDVSELRARAGLRACEFGECASEGLYPAPRSRTQLKPYLWFCLEHVREYNRAWNYYSGMSEADIEREIRRDTVWRRPSWRLGVRRSLAAADIFGLFGEAPSGASEAERYGLTKEVAEALILFELRPPVTLIEIKARYKQLVKEHHPDAHGGDRGAEERLKAINLANAALVSFFDGDERRPDRDTEWPT